MENVNNKELIIKPTKEKKINNEASSVKSLSKDLYNMFSERIANYLKDKDRQSEELNKLAIDFNSKVEEEWFLEDYSNEENNFVYEQQLKNYISELTNSFILNKSFYKKLKIIEVFRKIYSKTFYAGNFILKDVINNELIEIKNKEKIDKGNHFLFLYLDNLLNNERSTLGDDINKNDEIAPNIYIIKKEGNFFVSRSKDKKEIENIFNEYLVLNKEEDFLYEKIKKENTFINKNGNNITNIDFIKNKNNPLFIEYRNKQNLTESMFNKYKSFFYSELEKENIVINNKEEQSYLDFELLTNISFRNSFKKKTNLSLNEFSLTEQFYIIYYIKNINNNESPKFYNFINIFGVSGAKTFLSVAHGGVEIGDKILTLSEKLPKEIANKLFKKYSEITENVSKIVDFSKNNFSKEIKTDPKLISKIEDTLYLKGKNLLSEVYENINKKEEIDFKKIDLELDRINADTLTTFAIFKQAVRNGEKLPIESIEGSSFSKRNAIDIEKEKQNEMLSLYEYNWKNHPDKNFVESLKNYFKSSFVPEENKLKNKFYTFEKDNKIRAFIRFEEIDKGVEYASALNVDEASKNFGLGEAMMDEALAREAEENILKASCRKDNPSNMRYFEKGFISQGFKKTNDTEEFDLVWNEKKNKNILAKQKTKEELIKMFEKNRLGELEIKKEKDLNILNETLPEGKSLVRCFYDKYTGDWYAVYEVVDKNYGVNSAEVE